MNIERYKPNGYEAGDFKVGDRVAVDPTGRKRKPLTGTVASVGTGILPIRVHIDGCGAAPCYAAEHLRLLA